MQPSVASNGETSESPSRRLAVAAAARRLRVAALGGGMLLAVAAAAAAGGEASALAWTAVVVAGLCLVGLLAGEAGDRRRLDDAVRAAERSCAEHEQVIRQVLDRLKTGDLVEASQRVATLPRGLAAEVERATAALASLVKRIQGSSREVSVVGGDVQSTASDLASGFSEQSAAVVEITATIEELARTAAQIATNAERQAELAAHAEAGGDRGASAVDAAVEGLDGLRERIVGIATRADSLGSRSKEIYRILDLINEIAQETHILALNAAIEAETAGEHGRRFGVVAEEVRRLAQRARESVQSVRILLEEFVGAIRSTVVATEEGTKEADEVLQQARAAEDSIAGLRSALSETARASREISLATKEQRTASDQVAITIKEVREVIQRMAEGLRGFTLTAEQLNELALSIQLVTQSFRFDSNRSLKNVVQGHAMRLAPRAPGFEGLDGELEEILRSAPYVECLYLADRDGRLVALAVSPEWSPDGRVPAALEVGRNFSERPWFQAVQASRSAAVTPLYESLLTSEHCFTVAAPVAGEDGTPLGVLGADVNVRSWIRI
jgi:methyl-accepting chemotaxis protein